MLSLIPSLTLSLTPYLFLYSLIIYPFLHTPSYTPSYTLPILTLPLTPYLCYPQVMDKATAALVATVAAEDLQQHPQHPAVWPLPATKRLSTKALRREEEEEAMDNHNTRITMLPTMTTTTPATTTTPTTTTTTITTIRAMMNSCYSPNHRWHPHRQPGTESS